MSSHCATPPDGVLPYTVGAGLTCALDVSGQFVRVCVLCSDNAGTIEGPQVIHGWAFQERAPDACSSLHLVGPLLL